MNMLSGIQLEKITEEAVYNVYLYLTHIKAPEINKSFSEAVENLYCDMTADIPAPWKSREKSKLDIVRNAIRENPLLSGSIIEYFIRTDNGLTACTFKKPDTSISVVFKGTGSGEWIDNGEGLSGIPEENIYLTKDNSTGSLRKSIVFDDYATDQQVEALNIFNTIALEKNLTNLDTITVSGHSKGGNKAQFVAINSPLVDFCYSFDGQGFSPEAITCLKKRLGTQFDIRRNNILSIAAENDYVNVLGKRLMPEENIYYFKSYTGLHFMESLFSKNGRMNMQCAQGKLSRYIESVSDEIMEMKPKTRQYATLGVMNIFQKYFGKGVPVNADSVTIEKTLAGLAIAMRPVIKGLKGKL